MTLQLGLFFLALFSVAKASPFLTPNFNLYAESSNIINLKCSLFSGIVQSFPLNYPRQENIFFELRKPCRRMQYPVSQTQALRLNPAFNATRKTVVFISGWQTDINEDYTESLTKAYLCRGGFNFIVVNPSDYLRTEYINSAYNTDKIGEFVALGLKNLNIPGSNIHLIGHSLGAHIMGSAARRFAANSQTKIGRITGLDPARPCFINPPVFSRLSASDATYVDIIHSNVKEAGTEEPIGHADFYPSGLRSNQPGCLATDIKCSHSISIDYYIETVYKGNAHNFRATRCDSYAQLSADTCSGPKASMGYASNSTANGIYTLDVNAVSPYGKNALSSDYLKWNQCGLCPN